MRAQRPLELASVRLQIPAHLNDDDDVIVQNLFLKC